MKLSERKKRILRAIVDDYIVTAEPVGSKMIAEEAGLGLSSATIRNEMAELEAMGLIEKPHTSAGRIPSSMGYRLYVNELMRQHRLSIEETEEINRTLRQKIKQLDRLLSDAGRLTSRLTNLPAYALTTSEPKLTIVRFDFIYVETNTFIVVVMLSNNTVKNKLMRLPFSVDQGMLTKLSTVFNANFTGLTEDRITSHLITAAERSIGDSMGLTAAVSGFAIEVLTDSHMNEAYVAGTSQFLQYPEYQDIDKAHRILNYLSDEEELLKLPKPEAQNDIKITIGSENLAEELQDSSVVVAKYDVGDGMQGLIGVVGPTRMDYSRVAARLRYIANGLGWLFSGEDIPPPKITDGDDNQ